MYTDQVTYDNLSLHAVTAPVICRRITLRELTSDASPVGFNVAAPDATNPVFTKLPLESAVFEANKGSGGQGNSSEHFRYFAVGEIVGYIQPLSGTVTFARICE